METVKMAKIMIVEDDIIVGTLLKNTLTNLGYKITSISPSAELALKKLEEDTPDLIITDIILDGDIDGIDLAKMVIKNYKIPLIFLTSTIDNQTVKRIKETEVYGYLLKPFEEKELYVNIEFALYRNHMENEILQKNKTFQLIAEFDEAISFLSLNDIIGNTFKFLREKMGLQYSSIILSDIYKASYKRFVSWATDVVSQDEFDDINKNQISKTFIEKIKNSPKNIYVENLNLESDKNQNLDENERVLNKYLISKNIQSYVSIKLYNKEYFTGSLTIFEKEIGSFSEDTIRVLEILTSRLGMSIDNANLFETVLEDEKKFRNFADSLPQVVIEVDFNHKIKYANQNAMEVFGYTKDELSTGLFVYDMIDENEREKYFKAIGDLVSGTGDQGKEFLAKRRDGTLFHVGVYSNIIFRKGIPIGILAILIDVSQRKILEEERLKLKKLESVGVLAGGIAHDFNNILTAILGNVTLAKLYSNEDKVSEILEEAEKACSYAKELTQQLLTFSKGGLPIKKVGSIKDIITDSVLFLLRGSNVKANFDIEDELYNVEIDKGQINQVINNLILNAIKSMPEGGYIDISCKNTTISDNEINSLKSGNYIKVEIKDYGVGIPKENLSKIFDPYFTTNEKGSGLGLAITHSIIAKHNGYIVVNSELGKGTTFFIYLPATLEKLVVEDRSFINKNRHNARILIMDDEEAIREVANKILKKFGFRTELAEDGVKTIEMYKEALLKKDPYDVVIMDLTIPAGMGGKETIKYLLEIDPNVKAIVTSGYSNDMVINNYKDYGFQGVVSKPYKVEDLIVVIEKIISLN